MSLVLGIVGVEIDEEGREDEEEDVGEGVDKFSNIRGHYIILFTPVNRRGSFV